MNEEQKREHVTRLIEEAVEAIEYLTVVEYGEEHGLTEEQGRDLADELRGARVEVHLNA